MLRAHLILIAVLAASPAVAQSIYRWVDADGVTHYTDNSASVPQGVAVFATDGEPISHMGKPGPVPVSAAKKAAPAPAAVPDNVPSTDDGPNEVYWRAQFKAARERIRSLEDEITADGKRVHDVNVGYTCAPQIAAYGGYAPAPTATASVTVTPQGLNGRSGYGPVGQPLYVYDACIPRLNPEYDRTQRRIEKNKLALVRAKEDLHELERRAAFDAVPLEWRR